MDTDDLARIIVDLHRQADDLTISDTSPECEVSYITGRRDGILSAIRLITAYSK